MDYKNIIQILIITSLVLIYLLDRKINISKSYKMISIITIFIINFIGITLMVIYTNALKHNNNNNNITEEFISNGIITNILLFIPIIIGIGFIVFYLIKISLGNIDIKIFGDKFTSGENLTGEIKVTSKNNIKNANLYIYLRGYKYTVHRGRSGGTWTKKYEDKITLEKDSFFEANQIKTYNFNFTIPYLKNTINEYDKEKLIKELDNKGLTESEKQAGINLINNFSKKSFTKIPKEDYKKWKIEVELEKEGINLFNEKVINIIRNVKEQNAN